MGSHWATEKRGEPVRSEAKHWREDLAFPRKSSDKGEPVNQVFGRFGVMIKKMPAILGSDIRV